MVSCTLNMTKKKFPVLVNPFPVVGYNGAEYFCNREKEIKALRSSIINGKNISLIARRRIGKSSLLEHLKFTLHQTRPVWKVIYIDLIKTSSLEDLYKVLAKEIYESRKSGFLGKFSDLDIMSRLKVSISINSITQLPELSFELKESQTKQSFASLLDWISKEEKVVIIFDEFQQILSYPQPNVEGYLRSEMMRLPNVRFIFCGSDQRILENMFRDHSRPFFNSTQMMGLEPIEHEAYSTFIQSHFKKAKRSITQDAVHYILHVGGGETYAIQKICNTVFQSGTSSITLAVTMDIFKKVVNENQSYYERIRTLLGSGSVQYKLLRAISGKKMVIEPSGKEFMQANGFSNSSSVLKALKALEGYNLVSKEIIPDRGFGYYINDALFKAWLNLLPV